MTTTSPHWIVTAQEQGLRLDRFLAAAGRLGSRGRVRVALERGKVFVNDLEARVGDAASRLASGDVVRLWIDRPGSAKRRARLRPVAAGPAGKTGLQVIYEDETMLVVNKPAGLLTVPLARSAESRSVYSMLADRLGDRGRRRPFVVHRIDRDTSGVVVFAKTAAAQQSVKNQFARREPERVYWAVVNGRVSPSRGQWRDRLVWDADTLKQMSTDASDPKGVDARSDYRVMETFDEASLVEVRLHTGRRNQIRIQAALRGHALVGERQYATSAIAFQRQALHAHRLSFAHPIDGRRLTFEAPLPKDLAELLRRLRKSS